MIIARAFVAGAGFIPAEVQRGYCREQGRRRGFVGEPWVPPRPNICRCTGYVNIVEAVVAGGGGA
jgi:hypothetical protein